METITTEVKIDHNRLVNDVLNYNGTVTIDRPAVFKDGIKRINKIARNRYLRKFKKRAPKKTFSNFIPASGSASRMFKELVAFSKDFDSEKESFSLYVNRTKQYKLKDFFFKLKKLPFYNDIPEAILGLGDKTVTNDERKHAIAKYLIDEVKIHLKPKALQKFHITSNGKAQTALERQCNFHQILAKDFSAQELHFTINENYATDFQEITDAMHLKNLTLGWSVQNRNTDAYCLDAYNNLAVLEDGSLVKRPSGHGALLENLNAIENEYIYIHNIDNIPHPRMDSSLARESKVALGYLFFLEEKIHKFLRLLEAGKLTNANYKRFKKFCKNHLYLDFDTHLENASGGKMSTIYNLLNRPIRVCAMVPAQAHQGGGPYWITEDDTTKSLQIVESVEIEKDLSGSSIKPSTHFNPVAVYCSTKDYNGEHFDLKKFAKDDRKMLVHKIHEGRDVKYFEAAGLWNGAMHNWNTTFIEMKGKFFNPVKSVVDLLHNNHSKQTK